MKAFITERNAHLVYRIRSLGMGGAVLHIGAHPDDEDIGLLAYLARKYGVRAVYWSATRGEGGQNRIGPYRDEALGIYRTWESLEAREEDGGECLFGPFYDFGYSKNAEEALAKWGPDALLREVVRAIRMVQPQVIVCRWTGAPDDLHGHHQAVGQAAIAAFEVAGDPNRFPELKAQGLSAWTPLKYYHSTNNSGGDFTAGGALNVVGCLNADCEKDGFLRINTGEFDPIAGRTYQERAWLAYNKHQTQAMGLAPAPGDFFYYFRLHKTRVSAPPRETSIFDALDPTLSGLTASVGAGSPLLHKRLQAVTELTLEGVSEFRAHDPTRAANALLGALVLLRETLERVSEDDLNPEAKDALRYYLKRKIAEFEDVIAVCVGLELECLTDKPRIIPGEQFKVHARLWNHHGAHLDRAEFGMSLPKGWEATGLEQDAQTGELGVPIPASTSVAKATVLAVSVPDEAEFTCPYWLVQPRGQYLYDWPEGDVCGRPFAPPALQITAAVEIGDHLINLRKPVLCRQAFPGGFRELAPAVIPQISLHPKTTKVLLPYKDTEQSLELQVVARNNSDRPVEGRLELVSPPGWEIVPDSIPLSFSEPGATRTVQHTVTLSAATPPGAYELEYRIHCGKSHYALIVSPVRMGPPGLAIPTDEASCVKEEFILAPSMVGVHLLDVKLIPSIRYAYVQGAEEDLRDALKQLGISFHIIEDSEMGYLDLGAFDAVVIGPNAYLVREELRKYAARFLEYVNDGGILIVQYQGYRYQTPGLAPYPFVYSQPHDRVTEEAAAVNILEPDHLIFKFPNKIGIEDFDGWVRDRGLYFFGKWDRQYRPLLSCSDRGEDPKHGGLMECQYGKGTFIYTGYSFFRQLPAGVPGAFRLFANILSIPEARIRERIEFLRKIDLFRLLTPEQLDPVARIVFERWAEDGEYICLQGEEGEEMYVVYRGKVEVVRETDSAEEVIHVAEEGACLGEMAVLASIPRTASLRAVGQTKLLVIKGPHFVGLLGRHPDFAIQLIKLLVQRLAPRA